MARTEPRAGELTQRLPVQPPWQEQTERMPTQGAAESPAAENPDEAAADRVDGAVVVQTEVVAERPVLAPGVTLSGDMEESAFVEPQRLVQREGKFVQLTELLYRVVENVDGQHTLEEIAEQVGDAIDRDVTAENVEQLIAQKLIPLGLVQKADGSVARPEGEADGAARSPLQVNMKMAMVGPDRIRTFTAPLTFLYWPPVLLAVLAAVVVAQGWLYLVHGVGAGVHDVLYNPHLLLVVLAVIVAATGFHELGHAAALRYGGGEVRGMGAGFYLIYPAFYTDVTDNYRLGRWARVRTDLGGIYFNLLWAAVTIALYRLTGWEFLLASVILLNLQTVQQLLPFVRLDGYWVLADITGIPDFFTHMGAFLRSVLPIKWEGRKLPELKWWAKAVFAGYVLIVVPLLAFLVFVAVRSFPRIAATTWDSFKKQVADISSAFSSGDVLALLAGAVSTIALALPALGLIYMIYSLGKAAFGLAWRWSEGSSPKRALAMAGSAALVGLLAFLWAPQIPGLGRSGPLYAAAESNFVPVAPDERAALGDAFYGGDTIHEPMTDSRPAEAYARATEIALSPTAEASTPAVGTPQVSPSPSGAAAVESPLATPAAIRETPVSPADAATREPDRTMTAGASVPTVVVAAASPTAVATVARPVPTDAVSGNQTPAAAAPTATPAPAGGAAPAPVSVAPTRAPATPAPAPPTAAPAPAATTRPAAASPTPAPAGGSTVPSPTRSAASPTGQPSAQITATRASQSAASPTGAATP